MPVRPCNHVIVRRLGPGGGVGICAISRWRPAAPTGLLTRLKVHRLRGCEPPPCARPYGRSCARLFSGNRKGVTKIPFESIEKLEFPSVKYTGGWLKVVSKDETIRLTVVIEDIGDLLGELRGALDRAGLSDRYDRKRMFSFFKTAVFADLGWARLYRVFWRFILAALLCAAGGVLCAFLAGVGLGGLIFWPVISSQFPIAVYLYTEIVFGRRVAKASDEESFSCPGPDPVWENAIYRKASAFGAAIWAIASAIAFFIASGSAN